MLIVIYPKNSARKGSKMGFRAHLSTKTAVCRLPFADWSVNQTNSSKNGNSKARETVIANTKRKINEAEPA